MTLLLWFTNYLVCGLLYLVGLAAIARTMPVQILNFYWFLRDKFGDTGDENFNVLRAVLLWPLGLIGLGLAGFLYYVEARKER